MYRDDYSIQVLFICLYHPVDDSRRDSGLIPEENKGRTGIRRKGPDSADHRREHSFVMVPVVAEPDRFLAQGLPDSFMIRSKNNHHILNAGVKDIVHDSFKDGALAIWE